MMRVYLAASVGDLEALRRGETLTAATGYAATERLAAEHPDADDDELAYAAMMAAAGDSRGGRRIVVSVDVAADEGADAGVVGVPESVRFSDVVSFHVGATDADDDLGWYATQELPDLLIELRGGA